MKICPFISHMVGQDSTSVLEARTNAPGSPSPEESDIVILGYDEGQVALKSQTSAPQSTATADSTETSHLYCIRETCRFYQKEGATCMFDSIFETVDKHAKGSAQAPGKSADGNEATALVTKELEKFWKFQTKSVSELISSVGDAEKQQTTFIKSLREDLEGLLKSRESSGGNEKEIKDLQETINSLRQGMQDREEGMENFTTTVSEIVMNIEESLQSLRTESKGISSRIDKLDAPNSGGADLEKFVESAIERQFQRTSSTDVSTDVRSLTEQVNKFVQSTAQFENGFQKWQAKIESRVDEIHTSQKSWAARFDEIDKRQADVIEMMGTAPSGAPVDDAAKRNRQEAKKLNNLGVKSFHHGELKMARDQFLNAVELDTEFSEAYNNLGLVYTEIGETEEATRAFGRAIEINPDLHAAYNNLGYAFYRDGDYEQAVEMYKKALERSESSSSAYTNLGNACYKMGKKDEARDAWQKAIDLDPGNEKASRNIKRLEHE